MISDIISEAIHDLGYYQKKNPRLYASVAREMTVAVTVMEALLRYLDYPPSPHPTLSEYEEKHHAICVALRRLDVSNINRATHELLEYPTQLNPSAKRSHLPERSPLRQGSNVLGRVVDRIQSYQEQPIASGYESLTGEIEIVVTVIAGTRDYLEALTQPQTEDFQYVARLTALGESIRELQVSGLEVAMRELFEYLRLSSPSLA